jgi:ankyrin repeat protein
MCLPPPNTIVLQLNFMTDLSIVFKLLPETGMVDINASTNINGQTTLISAAQNFHEAIVKLFLTTDRVDVNASDVDGWTPLIWAVHSGYWAVVKPLLDTGKVDVNATDSKGWTSLSLWLLKITITM